MGVVIASIILLAFTTLITKAIAFNSANGQRLKATLYLQELIEVAKDLEQSDWNLLITCVSSQCHPEELGGSWNLNGSGPETIDIYTRSLTLEHVCRHIITNEILSGPCDSADPEYDEYTKKVIAQIDWNDRFGQAPLELEAYVYNYNP